MADCTVQFYCPPMKINRYPDGGFLCHRTDAEPMVCTVTIPTLPDPRGEIGPHKFLTISPVTIPPTLSRPTGLMEWTVDACVGEGTDFNGASIRVELPKERVAFKWFVGREWVTPNEIFRHFWKHGVASSVMTDLPNLKWPVALIAEPIDAVCTLWLSDGRIFRTDPNVPDSFVRFGECKVIDPLFNPTAEALTTTKGNLVEVLQ